MSAVLDSLGRKIPVTPHIFTSVPDSIFTQSLKNYRYHNCLTDIGFVQNDAFHIDIEATCSQLDALVPFSNATLDHFAEKCKNMSLIVCDISPLGLCVSKKLGIPSVLIENFTWDWLYDSYSIKFPRIGYFSRYYREQFAKADYHIQTEPLCNLGEATLHCGPIFRRIRSNPQQIKQLFPCGQRRIVLITMGGISFIPSFLNSLKQYKDFFFIFAGQEKTCHLDDNIFLLDKVTDHYHPDLINCADLVVFKSGYSTLAECYQVGKASLCIQRDGFAESKVLEKFTKRYLQSTIISQENFFSGKWLELLPSIVSRRPHNPARENGADIVADFITTLL